MIRKIKTAEYLKGYDAMSDGERKDYLKRVGEWLAGDGKRLLQATDRPMAKAQNIILLSARWSKDDCQAFYEGTLLLSALAGKADTWLPTQFYAKSAYRVIRQMTELLGAPEGCKRKEIAMTVAPQGGGAAAHYNHEPKRAAGAGAGHPQALPAPGAGQSPAQAPQAATMRSGDAPTPVRPRHIDQYVHLLPKDTQERASQVKGLLRDLDEAREKARLLMDKGDSPDKIELWARHITRIDSALKKIYTELDSEWDKLVKQGRVRVDDLGNAYVVDTGRQSPDNGEAAPQEPAELTSEQKQLRRKLRKFLTDTRRGNGDTRTDHVEKWMEAWKEYLTLEPKEKALADQKILEAMKHYGILE